MGQIDHVIFDVGNVLVGWNPRNLYTRLIADEAELDRVLAEIVPMSWHGEFDAGKAFATGVEERIALYPHEADLIRAWNERWPEMFTGPIEGSVAIMCELKNAGVSLFGITNYNREKFDEDASRFEFYRWFDEIVVSGDVGMVKPDSRIYRLLIERVGFDPARGVFIDDRLENVRAAEAVGLVGHHFTDPEALRVALLELGLPLRHTL